MDGVARGRLGGLFFFGTVTTGRREEEGRFFIDAGLVFGLEMEMNE